MGPKPVAAMGSVMIRVSVKTRSIIVFPISKWFALATTAGPVPKHATKRAMPIALVFVQSRRPIVHPTFKSPVAAPTVAQVVKYVRQMEAGIRPACVKIQGAFQVRQNCAPVPMVTPVLKYVIHKEMDGRYVTAQTLILCVKAGSRSNVSALTVESARRLALKMVWGLARASVRSHLGFATLDT